MRNLASFLLALTSMGAVFVSSQGILDETRNLREGLSEGLRSSHQEQAQSDSGTDVKPDTKSEQHRRTSGTDPGSIESYSGWIDRLELIDSASDNVLVPSLGNDMIITSAKPSFSINAIVNLPFRNLRTRYVEFQHQGPDSNYTRLEYLAPYAMCGNEGRNFFHCRKLGYGTHTIQATPRHTVENSGPTLTITFRIQPPLDENTTEASTLRANTIVSFINNITLTGTALAAEDPTIRWLIHKDPLQLSPDSPPNRFRLQQRYAVHKTLNFTDVVPPNLANILSAHECTWGSLDCNDRDFGGSIGVQRIVTWIDSFDKPLALTSELGLLPYVTRFLVFRSRVEGTLPTTIGRWTDLIEFKFRALQSTTAPISLPSNVGNWNQLESFEWTDNYSGPTKHTGTLPSEIGQWSRLKEFRLGGRNITGTFPSSIGAWTDLRYFQTGSTSLQGPLPTAIGQWSKLEGFVLSECPAIRSTIPEAVGNWKVLSGFQVDRTSLTGTIPASVGQWTALSYASFRDTNLTGSVPNVLCNNDPSRYIEADCVSEITCQCCDKCF